ncbi:iron donor protein CyaY [Parvibium lacunae]|uniref:Iron-sulfur cluster assembly protein CyaY n=1 Tax=Parvibium lacunae TaxID=1888893 RepID=A0A368KZL3_9BURK|nr:iron donor protein CyaY [Parvibium lacunae]RCS56592.1 iron donor protein CyaY [Parvibium lacunae]
MSTKNFTESPADRAKANGPISESEFLALAERTLRDIEDKADHAAADIDPQRSGNVLTLEDEQGDKWVINIQAPMQEIWLATKEGAYHYRYDPHTSNWLDTRGGESLFGRLSKWFEG